MSVRSSCDVLEYKNLTMRPVFTDWLITSQVVWHLLNEVNQFVVSETILSDSGLIHYAQLLLLLMHSYTDVQKAVLLQSKNIFCSGSKNTKQKKININVTAEYFLNYTTFILRIFEAALA